jgi:hypothetical protein
MTHHESEGRTIEWAMEELSERRLEGMATTWIGIVNPYIGDRERVVSPALHDGDASRARSDAGQRRPGSSARRRPARSRTARSTAGLHAYALARLARIDVLVLDD